MSTRPDKGLLRPYLWKPETLAIISLLKSGKTPKEIRAIVKNARGDCIRQIAKRIGMKPFPPGFKTGSRTSKRLGAIKAMRAQGATYEEIGKKFGVTKQNIYQTLNYRNRK